MKTPNSIQDYIHTHQQFLTSLTNLNKILEQAGLKGEIECGEPVYTRNGIQILGFRAFEDYVNLWFKNDLDDDSFLKTPQYETKGLHQLRFEKGEDLNEDLILSHVSAAIQRLESDQKNSLDKKKHTDQVTEDTRLTKGKRINYGDAVV